MNDYLRKECKMLKVFNGIPYCKIAKELEIKQSSFYSWLNNQYDFSPIKLNKLQSIILELKKEWYKLQNTYSEKFQKFIEEQPVTNEEWKEISGSDGKYYCSSFGRILSLCGK